MDDSNNSEDLIIDTYAGVPGERGLLNGPKATSKFSSIWACCLAPRDGVFVSDLGNHVIRLIDGLGMVTTYAGTGEYGLQEGPRLLALLTSPTGMFLCEDDTLLVSDKDAHCILRIYGPRSPQSDFSSNRDKSTVGDSSSSGSVPKRPKHENMVEILAGTGDAGDVDGPCRTARFRSPIGIVECNRGILVADWSNNKIRCIAGGLVTTFAGTGNRGTQNGTRLNCEFYSPVGLCLNRVGDIYVSDRNNHQIRVIRTNNTVDVYCGQGERGLCNGTKQKTKFQYPWALCMSPLGDVVVCDEYNNRVVVVPENGLTTTLVGNDGFQKLFAYPACACISAKGEVFIADRDNYCIRRIIVKKWSSGYIDDFTKLSLIGLKDMESLADTTIQLRNDQSVKIHSQIALIRCPQILEPELQKKVQDLNISEQAVDALIYYFYDNRIPKLSLLEMCELKTLACTLKLSSLVDTIHVRLKNRLCAPHTSDELLDLLYKVPRIGEQPLIANLIVERLREHRHQIFPLQVPSTPPVLSEICSKIFTDDPLDTVIQPDKNVAGELETQLLELYSQVEAEINNSMTDIGTFKPFPTSISVPTNASLDFEIRWETKSLKCHKWVLCARWPFLRQVIDFGGHEAQTNTLDIPPTSFTSFRLLLAFIKYLYTNQLDGFNLDTDAKDILRLASEFRLQDATGLDSPGFGPLLTQCRASLVSDLSEENCIEVYKNVCELGSEDQQIAVRSFLLRSVPSLTSNPDKRLELEGLGTAELVRLLHTLASTSPN